jgi:hypothetical protein
MELSILCNTEVSLIIIDPASGESVNYSSKDFQTIVENSQKAKHPQPTLTNENYEDMFGKKENTSNNYQREANNTNTTTTDTTHSTQTVPPTIQYQPTQPISFPSFYPFGFPYGNSFNPFSFSPFVLPTSGGQSYAIFPQAVPIQYTQQRPIVVNGNDHNNNGTTTPQVTLPQIPTMTQNTQTPIVLTDNPTSNIHYSQTSSIPLVINTQPNSTNVMNYSTFVPTHPTISELNNRKRKADDEEESNKRQKLNHTSTPETINNTEKQAQLDLTTDTNNNVNSQPLSIKIPPPMLISVPVSTPSTPRTPTDLSIYFSNGTPTSPLFSPFPFYLQSPSLNK